MPPAPAKIREWRNVDRATFEGEIMPANQPAVLRGLAADWPAVRAGLQSHRASADYIKSFDRGDATKLVVGAPSIAGRLFYRSDMSDFNFEHESTHVGDALERMLAQIGAEHASVLAVQSAPVAELLPGFERENTLELLDASVTPRIWIGNSTIVAAHFDLYYNIACVAAGRRRFTLFPPEQLPNLYVGPIEFTPGGAPISMVSFDEPDFERFPRFAEALVTAQTADLAPGDAIYIPYAWWHHVRALDDFNVLVNYWWNDARTSVSPTHAMLHAALALRDLPEDQRDVWRGMLDYYVFQTSGAPLAHLPAPQRGAFGPLTRERRSQLAQVIARALSNA